MKKTLAIALLSLLSLVANASLRIDSMVNCAGDLSIFAPPAETSRIACTGSLSFSEASLESSTPLDIFAGADLSFLDVLVRAPSLSFRAGGALLIDAGTVVIAPLMVLTAQSITVDGSLLAPVPEPSMPALWLAGLVVLVAAARRRVLPGNGRATAFRQVKPGATDQSWASSS